MASLMDIYVGFVYREGVAVNNNEDDGHVGTLLIRSKQCKDHMG